MIQFDGKAIEDAAGIFPELVPIRDLLDRALRGVRFNADESTKFAGKMEALGGLSGGARLASLLGLLSDMATSDDYQILSTTQTPMMKRTDIEKMQRVIRFIQASIERDISLHEIAEVAGMTQTSLSRFFKKNAGMNYIDFITHLRIGKQNVKTVAIYPTEGGAVWADAWFIPKTAENIDSAYAYINQALDPQVQASVCKTAVCSTVSKKAVPLMDETTKALFDYDNFDEQFKHIKIYGQPPRTSDQYATYDDWLQVWADFRQGF